jgi:hypothetical protein
MVAVADTDTGRIHPTTAEAEAAAEAIQAALDQDIQRRMDPGLMPGTRRLVEQQMREPRRFYGTGVMEQMRAAGVSTLTGRINSETGNVEDLGAVRDTAGEDLIVETFRDAAERFESDE